jgi:RecA/RadA recombinase
MVERRRKQKPSNDQIDKIVEEVENLEDEPPETEDIVGPKKVDWGRLIPSGSTLINCGCSDNPFGAYVLGTINTIPGKSQGGKSALMLTMLACCANDERFDDHLLIYDDGEQTNDFDIPYLFPPLAKIRDGLPRLLAPAYTKKDKIPVHSNTIQDFKTNILKLLAGNKPFIYVQDSLDSLSSDEEMERSFKEALESAIKLKSPETIEAVKVGYKTEKARHVSTLLRTINSAIKSKNSTLFIVQQTKQVMGAKPGQRKWYTVNGEAPYFYSYHRLYFKQVKSLTNEYRNIKNKIGGVKSVEIIKNKLNGKIRSDGIQFDYWDDYGLDDVGSCIDFLKKTKEWKSDSAGIIATGINETKMPRIDLINYIEKNNLERQLQEIVGYVWSDIEEYIRLGRRKAF